MVYRNIRVRVPVSDMKELESLLYQDCEYSGVFEVQKHSKNYVARLDHYSVKKGSSRKFEVKNMVEPDPSAKHISFHTHPNLAYTKLAAVLAPPSIPDYKAAFYRILCGEAAHMVVTLEGPYLIRLQKDALKFFRGLLQTFRTSNIATSLANCLDKVNIVMTNLERARFVEGHFAQRARVRVSGNNQNRRFYHPNGTIYTTADFLLHGLSANNVRQIQTYAKTLYKTTTRAIKTITINDIIQSFQQGLTTQQRNRLDEYIKNFPKRTMDTGVFHIRVYHRNGRRQHTSVALLSDYSQSISFTLAMDTSWSPMNVDNNRLRPEEFTRSPRTPSSFTRNNASPYTRRRTSGGTSGRRLV